MAVSQSLKCEAWHPADAYLALQICCQQHIPCSKVSVDETLLGEVLHSISNLPTESQQCRHYFRWIIPAEWRVQQCKVTVVLRYVVVQAYLSLIRSRCEWRLSPAINSIMMVAYEG